MKFTSDATFDNNYLGECFWEKKKISKTFDKNNIIRLKVSIYKYNIFKKHAAIGWV